MIEQSIEIGGRPEPAYITLRNKYGAHRAGCIRREIMAKKKANKLQRLKAQGLPIKKPSKMEAIEVTQMGNDYNATRHRAVGRSKYRGSEDEMEHRLGMRLPKR